MFKITTSLRIALAAIMLLFATAGRSTAQDYSGNASYQQFYDELSPYGEWVYDSQYGYVWVPDAGDDFRPYYTNGYWVNTDYGNTWVSDYDWGWAPFHYGRWTYSSYYGWTWIPGNQWGPAWVSWRSGGGCYGWAPMGPGISVNFSFGSSYYVPDYWWNFTPQQYILDRRFHNYSYGPRYNTNYIHKTTIINNTYVNNRNTYIAGPRRRDLEVATGRPVRTVAISNVNRPNRSELRNDRLNIYRPLIAETRPRATERPRTFQRAEQALPANNREAADQANRTGNRPVRDRSQLQQDRTPRGSDRPIGNLNEPQRPRTIERGNDRPNVQQQDRTPRGTDRPIGNLNEPQRPRTIERNNDRPDVPNNPGRVDQPQRNRNEGVDNRNSDRTPFRQPRQQVEQQDQQRARQQQIDQQRAQHIEQQRGQQQQVEQQRAQQQQVEQQRAQQAEQQRTQQRAQQQQQVEQQRAQRQQVEQQRAPQERQPRVRDEQRIEQPRNTPQREQPVNMPVREQRAPDGGGEGRRRIGR